jgi:hypothetical protein
MKKVLFIVILLMFSTLIFAQSLDGFLGLRFGTTADSVKKIMLAKPGCKLGVKSTKDVLMFTDCKFAGRGATLIVFRFINNKFHTGRVFLSPSLDSKIVELFNTVKGELNERYYTTTQDYERYDYPYEKGDGYYESAIKLGKAHFSAYWDFTNPKSENKEDNNIISLEIDEDMYVIIGYQDGALIKEAVEAQKSKDYKDY